MNSTPRIDKLDKNYFINGDFRYFQRGGVTVPVAITTIFDYVSADRFDAKVTGVWTSPTSSRSTLALSSRTKFSHLFQGTPTILTDKVTFRQKIESINAIDLVNQSISLGLKYKNDNFTSFTVTLYTANVEDDFSAVTQIAQLTSPMFFDNSVQSPKWENIAIGAGAANGLMMEVEFSGVNALAATNLYIGEVKLNIGDTLQEFSLMGRNSIEELQLCQRYFCKTYKPDVPVGFITGFADAGMHSFAFSNGIAPIRPFTFPVSMRVVPVITQYDPFTGLVIVGFKRHDNGNSSGINTQFTTERSWEVNADPGTNGWIYIGHATADSEL